MILPSPDSAVATEPTPATAGTAPARPRVFTPRAIVLGGGLAAAMAWLTPWNDWYVHNSYLYCDFLPPVVMALLLVLAVAVNPLLRSRRLARGELAVVAALLLSVGGFASSGFARYWSIVVAGPARKLARAPYDALKTPLDEASRATLRRELAERARDDFDRLDADHDGRLSAAEAWGGAERIARDDGDHDGALSRDEYVAGRLAHDAVAAATWRYAFPSDLFLGVPEAGAIDVDDPEYRRVVDGYLEGAMRSDPPRVAHGARVTWRDARRAPHEREPAWGGATRESHRRVGAIDLDDDLGRALAGARAGQTVDTPDGPAQVIAVEPPAVVPARSWLRAALAWSPLVIGLAIASVAAAFVVRRQWTEHERLPYPVSSVLGSLLDDPARGARLPAMLRTRAFRVGFALSFGIIAWRGLYANGLMPVDFTLGLDLGGIFWSSGLTGCDWWWVSQPHVYFTFIGLAFLTPLEISGGLWFCLLAEWAITTGLRKQGVEVRDHDMQQVGFGVWAMLALLVLWLGRTWYWRVVCAAIGRSRDPAAREAAPWLWALFAGMGLIVAWLAAHGAPVGAAIALTLIVFGCLLVISRGLAEAGIPLAVFPGAQFDGVLHSAIGTGMPIAALLPLAVIGMVLTDPREALMPYATTGAQLGARAGASGRRFGGALIAMSLVGACLSCAAMVWIAYHHSGHTDGYAPYAYEMDALDWRCADAPGRAAEVAALRGREVGCLGIGALITALLGAARALLPWWPLHPLPLAFALCYAGEQGWCSFFVAWAVKGAIMRYGGVSVYKRVVPAAIGLIAGESVASCVFTVIKLVATGCFDRQIPSFGVLPG